MMFKELRGSIQKEETQLLLLGYHERLSGMADAGTRATERRRPKFLTSFGMTNIGSSNYRIWKLGRQHGKLGTTNL